MKKLSLIILVLGIAFACKKKDPASTTYPIAATAVTTFSIDGHAATNLRHASFKNDSAHYGVIAYDTINGSPEIQIIFSGTVTPGSGMYQIITGIVGAGKCSFTLLDTSHQSSASSGFVNVTTSNTAPNNVATFSNVAVGGGAGNHIISGSITY
ncbi:MAG: hypothetical protein ABI388_04135 [Bacteroidia bacterium]